MISDEFEKTLQRTQSYAKKFGHFYMTLEHLLLSLLDDQDVRKILLACSIDDKALKKELESFIDNIEVQLEKLTSFILPGGDIWNGYTHLARAVCRRAERRITALNTEEKIDNNILIFMNRLSDYFFVLARRINLINDVNDIKWNT